MVAYRSNAPVRLSDVANVIEDTENNRQAAWTNKTPAIIMNIQRQPNANIISVVDSIKKQLPKLSQTLPPSVRVQILTDRTTTIRASVADVFFELLITILLVVAVIFIFLRTLSRNLHRGHCRAALARGHLCGDVHVRVQHQ